MLMPLVIMGFVSFWEFLLYQQLWIRWEEDESKGGSFLKNLYNNWPKVPQEKPKLDNEHNLSYDKFQDTIQSSKQACAPLY